MNYKCYVFDQASALINSIEQYKEAGGQLDDIKVLIKDVDHGRQLSASGLRHVDYLSEISNANQQTDYRQHGQDEPHYYFGLSLTSGQYAGVVNGSYDDDHLSMNGMNALLAYGLSEDRAREAFEALRAGHFLLFVPIEEGNQNRYFNLGQALSASFGEMNNRSGQESEAIRGAAYTIDDE